MHRHTCGLFALSSLSGPQKRLLHTFPLSPLGRSAIDFCRGWRKGGGGRRSNPSDARDLDRRARHGAHGTFGPGFRATRPSGGLADGSAGRLNAQPTPPGGSPVRPGAGSRRNQPRCQQAAEASFLPLWEKRLPSFSLSLGFFEFFPFRPRIHPRGERIDCPHVPLHLLLHWLRQWPHVGRAASGVPWNSFMSGRGHSIGGNCFWKVAFVQVY